MIQIMGAQIIELYSRGITVRCLADPRHWLGARLSLPFSPLSAHLPFLTSNPFLLMSCRVRLMSCSVYVGGAVPQWFGCAQLHVFCSIAAAPPCVGTPGKGHVPAAGPIGSIFESFGAVKAGAFTAARLLREREAVLLFPGGGREARRCRCSFRVFA